MQEFSSISVSSYEAGSLADRLTEQSRDGWHVVAVVPTGSTVTAYLCRDTDGAEPAAPTITESEPTPEPEPAIEPEPTFAAVVPEPAAEPAPEPAPEPASDEPVTADVAATSDTATSDTSTSDATAAAAGAAPAGWYADPAGRFELRYWDGGQWTEHVSRAGQQYTDPPVA